MFHIPLIELVVAFILAALAWAGLPGLAGLMAVESFGIPPLPSEIILLFSGFLIARGTFSWPGALAAAVAGSVGGSYFAYWLGRDARGWLFPVDRAPRVPIERRHIERMDRWFDRHGEGLVLVARLFPVVRSYVSYPAGAARMSPSKFGIFTTIGVIPFTLALLAGGYLLGSDWSSIVPYFSYLDDAALVIVGLGVVYLGLLWADWISSGFPPRWVRGSRPSEPPRASP